MSLIFLLYLLFFNTT